MPRARVFSIYQVFQILGFSDNANHRMAISEEVITPMTSQDKEIVFYLADDVASVSVDGLF